jgi:lysophospholipase L1-like esterase
MRSAAALTAALASLLLLAPAIAGAALPRRAFVAGDSLAEGTGLTLSRNLPRWSLRFDVDVSRHVDQGVALLRAQGASLEPVVVLQLGTNDDPNFVSRFRSLVRQVLAIAGPARCVVWPNIVRPPAAGASYDGYNRVLAAEAARHPNLRLVDWVGMVRRNPWWLAPDGVHVTFGGYAALARTIAGTMSRCRREPEAEGIVRRLFQVSGTGGSERIRGRPGAHPGSASQQGTGASFARSMAAAGSGEGWAPVSPRRSRCPPVRKRGPACWSWRMTGTSATCWPSG